MSKQFKKIFLTAAAVFWMSAAVAGDHGHAHSHFPKDIDAFHALLAPIWHATPGKERSRNACAQAPAMEAAARAITSADHKPLLAGLLALQARCTDKPAEIDAALSKVHDAFHDLIDVRPAAAAR